MQLKELWIKIKSDYRHFICIPLTIIFLLFAVFYFTYAFPRLLESFPDIWTSLKFYFSELFEFNLSGNITVNDFTKQPFEMPWNLPSTWEEFKLLIKVYWKTFINKENFLAYLLFVIDLLYYLSKFIIFLMPIFMIISILKITSESEINNDYNVDSASLVFFKKNIENKVYLPIKNCLYKETKSKEAIKYK